MLEVKNIEVNGIEAALRGMRNPLNSWSKSDSKHEYVDTEFRPGVYKFIVGENDMKLCKALIKAGSADRKFLRMIHVTMDITSSLYFWKEMDQYKIGTTTDSCSTMHKIHSRDLTLEDFSTDHLSDVSLQVLQNTISQINLNRRIFKETNDKEAWWQMIQLLPSSYNQMRTWDGDYETLMSIYFARRNHKLDEWHILCDEILKLPYMKEFIEVLDDKN